jgi:hypothetical protein
MASSSSSKTLRADELYSEHLIEFMDRCVVALLAREHACRLLAQLFPARTALCAG